MDEKIEQMRTDMTWYFKGAAAFMKFLCAYSDNKPLVSIIPSSLYEEVFEDFLKQFGDVTKGDSVKSKVIEYIKQPITTDARNRMGCSENWYNSYYAISQTFTLEEVQAMSEMEVEHLVKLGDTIAEYLY